MRTGVKCPYGILPVNNTDTDNRGEDACAYGLE